jgi:exodeoxyribonuclease VII small subunit
MNQKPKKLEEQEPFEQSLERLEGIVNKLESGEEGLEQSIKLFEEGSSLSKQLSAKLDNVKQKVEVLIKEGKDRFSSKPLEEAND